ncbi:phytoene desaturase family protein [Vitreimonas sp.]|uniref:phytoene desaturase family protein n=1 Tax=Vitreimonas sp. TaxID=3069702 RepID=UPI002EDA95C1
MAEQYDVIVIGAGHNGLTAALELASAGWSVLVLEAEVSAGGCAVTIEPLLPGFRHNPHANALMFTELMPEQIAPAARGVQLHHPAAQLGVAFADGRAPVILHRPDLLERTAASLGVYSPADAAKYVALKRASAPMGPLIRDGLYAAPNSEWFARQAEAVRRSFAKLCDVRVLGQRTARALIDDLFATPEVRLLLYHLATETGLGLEDEGGDLAFLSYSLWIAGRWRTVHGGIASYVGALAAAARDAGVQIRTSTRIARVVAEGERAVGVVTAAGETIVASAGVLAAAPIVDVERMLETGVMSRKECDEFAAFRKGRPGSIAGSMFCLKRAPIYKSARHDPEIDACLKTIVGHERPEDAVAQSADVRIGLLPKPAGVVRMHGHWDATLAPEGCQVVGVDSAFPAAEHLDGETWRAVEASFPEAFVDVWRGYCEDDFEILAMRCDATSRFERRMMVRMGADQYRASVSGLYLGGPGVYPGGGVHGACGHNAAQTMLADFNAGRGEGVSS